jgi:hypothetical protein
MNRKLLMLACAALVAGGMTLARHDEKAGA